MLFSLDGPQLLVSVVSAQCNAHQPTVLTADSSKKSIWFNKSRSWPGNPGDQNTLMYLQELKMQPYNLLPYLTVYRVSFFILGSHLYRSSTHLVLLIPESRWRTSYGYNFVLFCTYLFTFNSYQGT